MIKLTNISKSFGSLKAVDNISLEIPRGELFSFLGPNGAGKTTTIKMMVGLISPDSGSISIGGYDIYKDPIPPKRITGYVPDNAYLYDKLTGWEFFQVVGNFYRMSPEEIRREVHRNEERLGFGDWLDERIEGYSQGMRQRIAFAASFLHNPEILIIDEPMVGLDPGSARVIKTMLKEKAEKGITIFLSTHNLNVAEELSHRIAIINKGKLLAIGTMESLRQRIETEGNLEDLFLQLVKEEPV